QRTDLVPSGDFFYPYGLQWIFDAAAPWGQLASYLVYLSFWAFLALGTYSTLSRFFSGNAVLTRYVLLTAFWLTMVLTGELAFQTRYIAPLGVVLLFAALDGREGLWSGRRILFAFALFLLTLFEVAQAGYALVPIGFLVLVELALGVDRTRAAIGRWFG